MAAVMMPMSGMTALLGLDPVQRLVGLKWVDPKTNEDVQYLSGDEVGLMTVAFTMVVFVAGSLLFPDKPKTQSTKPIEA